MSAFARSKLPALLSAIPFLSDLSDYTSSVLVLYKRAFRQVLISDTQEEGMNEPEANLTTEEIPLDIDEFNLETVDAVFILAVILVFVLIVAVVCR